MQVPNLRRRDLNQLESQQTKLPPTSKFQQPKTDSGYMATLFGPQAVQSVPFLYNSVPLPFWWVPFYTSALHTPKAVSRSFQGTNWARRDRCLVPIPDGRSRSGPAVLDSVPVPRVAPGTVTAPDSFT